MVGFGVYGYGETLSRVYSQVQTRLGLSVPLSQTWRLQP